MEIVLTIRLTDNPRAETMIVDGLHDILYELVDLDAIDDDDDRGWEYKIQSELSPL